MPIQQDPSSPEPHAAPPPTRGVLSSLIRLVMLVIIAILLVLPFTPMAGKIKNALKELILAYREQNTQIVEKRVEVPKEIIKEVIKEVVKEVPAQPEPLPEGYIPRKTVDVATLYNGITIKTQLLTEQGGYASLERLNPDAYKAEFQLSVRVPRANQSLSELSRINPRLPSMLPDLSAMLPTAKVSGFYHKLYENKTNGIQRDLTRLNRILDRHNFFDCETILELTHPISARKALLIQSEMDVVADGSDGDRQPSLDEYIYLSDYYQPFTSYAWKKRTSTPNPLLSRWTNRLKKAKEEFATKGLSAERNRELKALIQLLELEIADMKSRSSLIAEKDPFIVISLLFRAYQSQNPFTPKIGDYAVVIHDGKMYPAICGDYGPTQKMGEASLFIAKTINPKATPYRRPESELKVTYLIFPNTAEKPNEPPNLERWHAKCSELLKELGTSNAPDLLHRWEDPFKKPEPPPAPVVQTPPMAPNAATPAPTAPDNALPPTTTAPNTASPDSTTPAKASASPEPPKVDPTAPAGGTSPATSPGSSTAPSPGDNATNPANPTIPMPSAAPTVPAAP